MGGRKKAKGGVVPLFGPCARASPRLVGRAPVALSFLLAYSPGNYQYPVRGRDATRDYEMSRMIVWDGKSIETERKRIYLSLWGFLHGRVRMLASAISKSLIN